jgi:hypothetical protein
LSFPSWFILCRFMHYAWTMRETVTPQLSTWGALLPCFCGTVSRTWCFPHILNLVAKVSHESHCLQHVLMHIF